jgi:hypothetical protein
VAQATPSSSQPASPTTNTASGNISLADGSSPLFFGTNPTPSVKSLCVNGTTFITSQDDEFAQDQNLNASDASVDKNLNVMWGTRLWYDAPNVPGFPGTNHDEIDTDQTFTPYYDPFRKAIDGSLQITAVPIPADHAADAILNPGPSHPAPYHYLSGLLNGRALTYGYIEVSAREDHLQGMWPAPLWLLAHNGSDGAGNGYTEMDANEAYGRSLRVYQTLHRGGGPDSQTFTTLAPNDDSYHTYGIYWTASTIAFLTDHVVTGGPYPNVSNPSLGIVAATGPESPIINMQVFDADAFGSPPSPGTIGSLNDEWFRWYQDTSAPCNSADITVADPAPNAT